MSRTIIDDHDTWLQVWQDPKLSLRDDVQAWLERRAHEHDLRWLLVHADDGVLWGRVGDDGRLVTAREVVERSTQKKALCFTPCLRLSTIKEARLFGSDAELLLWRDGRRAFNVRVITEQKPDDSPDSRWTAHFDEPQLLWGQYGAPLDQDFTLLWQGRQARLYQHVFPKALPIEEDDSNRLHHPPRLTVRHYLADDAFAQVETSRLVGLEPDHDDREPETAE